MINWIFLGLLIFGGKLSEFTSAESKLSYYKPLKHQSLNPENTVIVFDWHQVLQQQNFGKIAFELVCSTGLQGLQVLKPRVIAKINALKKQGLIAEKIIDGLIIDFPKLAPLRDRFIEILNDQPMIEESVNILKSLKESGYTIYMLSNIAEETLAELWHKQGDILRMFDGIYTPSKTNGYIQKPNPEFYRYFKNYIAEKGQDHKTLLFIDDRGKNIKAGFDEGIFGIIFSSAKQLKKILLDLKLLENEC